MNENYKDLENLGTFFTPYYIANWISQQVLKDFLGLIENDKIRIYDPTVGKGVFLKAFLNNLEKYYEKDPNIFSSLKEIRLEGSDLQQKLVDFTSKLIPSMISEKKNMVNIIPKIIKADGFDKLIKSPDTFNIIIGNPPYIRQEFLSKRFKSHLIKSISIIYPNFEGKLSKQADYYIFFIMAGYFALKKGGALAFIVSTSWMNSKFGEKFRKFLITLPARISFAYSPAERLILDAKINTMVIFIEKNESKDHELFNIHKLEILDRKKIKIISTYQIKRKSLTKISNWETYLFRLQPDFFYIYKLFEKHLIPLNQLAKIKTGIYTGLNDFFYIPINNIKESNQIIPNSKYLSHVIRSPKEIQEWKIDLNFLPYRLFICRKSKEFLKKYDNQTYKYISWGEKQKTRQKQKVKKEIAWPLIPSIRKRNPGWWSFPEIESTKVFLRYIYYQNFLQPYSQTPIYSDRCFHQIYPKTSINPKKISIILNFSITKLMIEINGRNTLGQGALKLETMSARILPILDCIDSKFWDEFSELNYSQLTEIELSAYKSIGIKNPKKIYEQINSIHHQLVETRINKSRNFKKAII